MTDFPITLADIQHARQTIRDVVINTPILPAAQLSSELGAQVFYKAVLLCGGNLDDELLARVLEMATVRQGRYLLLRTSVEDRPGGLARLINLVAETGASVLDLFHRRAMWRVPITMAGVELVLEVRDEEHAQAVLEHLRRHSYRCERDGVGPWPG